MEYNEQLRKIINDTLTEFCKENGIEVLDLKPETRLVDELGLDSLDMVDIAVKIEEQSGMKANETMTIRINTLDDLYRLFSC